MNEGFSQWRRRMGRQVTSSATLALACVGLTTMGCAGAKHGASQEQASDVTSPSVAPSSRESERSYGDATSPESVEGDEASTTATQTGESDAGALHSASFDAPVPSADATLTSSDFGVSTEGGGGNTSSTDEAEGIIAPPTHFECDPSVCTTVGCDPGFVSYTGINDGACLRICDTKDLFPLDNQEKVAALAAQKCAVIDVGFTVYGPNLTDLTGLETIKVIEGDFVVYDTTLSSLAGFAGLTRLGYSFVLSGNLELTELGLAALRTLGPGGMVVMSNNKLRSLASLDGADFSPMPVTIVGNAALESMEGLRTLTAATTLVFAQNNALADVTALNGLGSADNFTITDNPGLTAIELSTLSFVHDLTITNNASLQSVFLRCVGPANSVTVQNNLELESLIVPTLAATNLTVSSNPKLPQCSIQSVIEAAANASCTDNDETATCPLEQPAAE